MQKTCALLCLWSFLFAVPVLVGQQHKKALTNLDVVKLVKSGIPTDTILLAIENSKTSFDTSPDALIALSKNGVNKTIINAMLTLTTESASTGKPARLVLIRSRNQI